MMNSNRKNSIPLQVDGSCCSRFWDNTRNFVVVSRQFDTNSHLEVSSVSHVLENILVHGR